MTILVFKSDDEPWHMVLEMKDTMNINLSAVSLAAMLRIIDAVNSDSRISYYRLVCIALPTRELNSSHS
jgi:hypothetical protein